MERVVYITFSSLLLVDYKKNKKPEVNSFSNSSVKNISSRDLSATYLLLPNLYSRREFSNIPMSFSSSLFLFLPSLSCIFLVCLFVVVVIFVMLPPLTFDLPGGGGRRGANIC